MSRSSPSLLALLGLVAVAGYQNRGRISDMLSDARLGSSSDTAGRADTERSGGFLSEVSGLFSAGSAGSTLSAGLSDLVNRFKETGRADTAETWVSSQPNRPMDVSELESAIGQETLDELSQKTGLSRYELLLRLNAALPKVVDRFTPDGRLPNETEASTYG
ncbi:DUF937 domain-containing protein [Pseudotabrizicola sediminis]|uniref:DUF937 domain-containing protein n=1 Tax=Pseudotabrizicola sediminis TaxID=2486418 RepID=A0ABY2KR40_9RHOB|nr:YidB family protein [Pseudotabrizicola sediminis]TGD44738.1 DUF937 domain-containing protein [Pseudotabrizicola sediminis]